MPDANHEQLTQLLRQLASNELELPRPDALPPGLAEGTWSRDEHRGLWIPTADAQATGAARPRGASGVLPGGMRGQTYITAEDVLASGLSPQEVGAALASVRAADVACHIARILADVESPERSREADRRWARQLLSGDALSRAERLLDDGSRFLARQVLLDILKLALVLGQPGAPDAAPAGVQESTLAMLSLAQHMGALRTDGEQQWGGYPVGLALEIVANQSFYSTTPELMLVGRFGQVWMDLAVTQAQRRHVPPPVELYREVSGIEWEVTAAMVVAMHSQAVLHGFVRFPDEFFNRLGLPRDAVDAVLGRICPPQQDLAQLISDEAQRLGFDWTFNPLRRFPLTRLADGSVLILSPRLLLERVFDGVALYWEIVSALRERHDQRTEQRFNQVHADAVEAYCVEVARSIAPAVGDTARVFTESTMQSAWRSRRSGMPSVCDFVIDYGDAWLCVEVTTSRLTEAAVAGRDAAALNTALEKVVTDRKAGQLASTIRLLKHREAELTGGPAQPSRRYIPVLLTVYDFPVNNATMSEARDRLRDLDLLQPPIAPLVIMSLTGFEMVEALAERSGRGGADLIREWADSPWANGPIDSFLEGRSLPLTQPSRLRRQFETTSDRLYNRMRAGQGPEAEL